MRILVTGGTGFTGAALVHRLLSEGHAVVALDKQEGLQAPQLKEAGAEVISGSVTDSALVEQCVEHVDVVFHLAAAFRELNVPRDHYDRVNVEGTRIVVDAAHRHGVKKFIYCSTCGVHGHVADPPADEDAPITPADYYQQTKYEAEPIVKSYSAKGMRTVIFRPAAIYGPGDPERFLMIFKRVARGSFPMFGNGKALYHPLYIDNLIDAFMRCLDLEAGSEREYLIADEQYFSIEEIVLKVAQALNVDITIRHLPLMPLIVAGHVMEKVCSPFGITPPIFPRRVDWFRQDRAFDISRAKRELNYEPRVGLDEGLRRTAAWYRQHGYL